MPSIIKGGNSGVLLFMCVLVKNEAMKSHEQKCSRYPTHDFLTYAIKMIPR